MHIALAPPKEPNHDQPLAKDPVGRTLVPPTSDTAQANATRADPAPNQSNSSPQPDSLPQTPTTPRDNRVAFALVDSVAPESPSAAAGLQVNDRIVAFGAISLRSFSTPADAMSALPGLLSSHENIPVDVIVHREGSATGTLTLRLTPKRWTGRGLLGCHVIPTEVSQVDTTYAPDVATMAASHSYPTQQ